MAPLPPPPFSGIATFARAPHETLSAEHDVAFLGVPYDSATSSRSGARFGPRSLREHSLLLWGYNNALQVAPFERLKLVDLGDVAVVPPDIQATYAAIEAAADQVLSAGSQLVTLGGDHSITLPLLRAHARKHGPLAVLHFDAHGDTWDYEYPGQPYSHGTPFIRALQEGLIDREAYIQLGIRGPTGSAQDYLDAVNLGARLITYDDFHERGLTDVLSEIHTRLAGRPVYVTFDIDCVDPAFAPGTGTPEVGGFTSYEVLRLMRGLRGLHLVGMDLVEVSPPFDHSGITAILGANVVFEYLSLIALGK